MSDLQHAPTSVADEKSTHLAAIALRDIKLPEGARPLLERKMRVRRLDVFPGGVIGLHDHSDRPAILYVLRGSMIVHDNQRDEPRVIEEGEAITEFNMIRHWARNCSDKLPLALLTFDLLDDSANPVPTGGSHAGLR